MRRFVYNIIFLGYIILLPAQALAECDLVPNGTTILTPETRPAGTIIYNKDWDVHQVCLANGTWQALGALDDPCADNPTPGTKCSDGSFFAGQVGGASIFVTSSAFDAERSWNNGTSSWSATGMGFCDTPFGQPSCSNGHDNTALLASLEDGREPYRAASYCAGLSDVHGHSDWYLPSRDELALLWNGGSPIADVSTSPDDWYWSSSEASTSTAWAQNFSSGAKSDDGKNLEDNSFARCARRE